VHVYLPVLILSVAVSGTTVVLGATVIVVCCVIVFVGNCEYLSGESRKPIESDARKDSGSSRRSTVS